VLGVPQAVARRVVQEVVTRTLRQFDRIYAGHFPAEPGLLEAAAMAPTPADGAPATAEPARGEGADPAFAAAAQAIERRILRVLRHVVLPEMRARLSA